MNTTNSFAALKALVRKDLVLYFSNRRALIMSIVAPIVIAAFFGSVFGSGNDKPSKIPIAVTDLDGSTMSKKIVAALVADSTLEAQSADGAAALEEVRKGKVRASIVLPAGFGAQAPSAMFGGGTKPVIDVRFDPSQSSVLAIVRGLLSQHVMDAVSQSVFGGSDGGLMPSAETMAGMQKQVEESTTMDPQRKGDLATMFASIGRVQRGNAAAAAAAAASGASASAPRAGGAFTLPFETHASEITSGVDRKYNGYAHSFAGMGVQFILFMGVEAGIGVLLARRLGLWKRLRAAPLSRTMLLGSHILSGALIAFTLMCIIYAAAVFGFGVRIEGSVPGFFGVVAAFALLTSTFGLLIAALGKTPEATRGLAIFATLVMVMLGGAWIPSFVFPQWMQTATLVVPTRWAVDGLDAMTWRGLGFGSAAASISALLAFSALFAAIAIWRFDWEEPRG